MSTFVNEGGSVGVQAGQYIVHGDSNTRLQGDQALDRLPFAEQALFNSYFKQHESTCLDGTRVGILSDIIQWGDAQDGTCIFWLNGLAGTGKSTIARTIARNYYERGQLGASFFFSKGGKDTGNARKFFPTLAKQLARMSRILHRHICEAVAENNGIAAQSLRDQWRQLIFQPLSKLGSDSLSKSFLVVLDALDECEDEDDIQDILQLLAEAKNLQGIQLRILLTSRRETAIRLGFEGISETEYRDVVLHHVDQTDVEKDIYVFLKSRLGNIRTHLHDTDWPSEPVLDDLTKFSGGLFIWADTACRFISKGRQFAKKRLSIILETGKATGTSDQHLTDLYTAILKQCDSKDFTQEERDELYTVLATILGSLSALLSPLSIDSLSNLLRMEKEDLASTLEELHAIIDIPDDNKRPLRLHHPSFRDFVFDQHIRSQQHFSVSEEDVHRMLAENCLQLMSATLRKNILNIDHPGISVMNVEKAKIDQKLPPEVRYACVYWVQHVEKGKLELVDHGAVYCFLRSHSLHWIEALGWMKQLPSGLLAISALRSLLMMNVCPILTLFVEDLRRVVLQCSTAIEKAPLQTYCSALAFAPHMSIVKRHFIAELLSWMQEPLGILDHWNPFLQSLNHTCRVKKIALSTDGAMLASVTDDGKVHLWNAHSGVYLQTLGCHEGKVECVAFSSKGVLASISCDGSIKFWDIRLGKASFILTGEADADAYAARTITFSPDGSYLVSSLAGHTVKTWRVDSCSIVSPCTVIHPHAPGDSRTALDRLSKHEIERCHINFSPNGEHMILYTSLQSISVWLIEYRVDLEAHADLQCLGMMECTEKEITDIAISAQSTLAILIDCRTIEIWSLDLRRETRILEIGNLYTESIALSSDGEKVATKIEDQVNIWDVGSGALLFMFYAITDVFHFSANSRHLILADDSDINLFDISNEQGMEKADRYGGPTSTTGYLYSTSPSTTPIIPTQVNGYLSGSPLLERIEDKAAPVTLSHNPVQILAFSQDGLQVASGFESGEIKIQDADTGAMLHKVQCDHGEVYRLAFSSDNSQLAIGVSDTIHIWNNISCDVVQTLRNTGRVKAMSFSPDGRSLVAADFFDDAITIWDISSRTNRFARLTPRKEYRVTPKAIAVSPDMQQLVLAQDNVLRFFETRTFDLLKTIDVVEGIQNISFSRDATHLNTNLGPIYHLDASGKKLHAPQGRMGRLYCLVDEILDWQGKRIAYLPPEHESVLSVQHGNTLAFGTESGHVLILRFSF